AMLPALGDTFGNPSSMHGFGKRARIAVEKARAQIADGIGASPNEIIFTSGATEANNLALIGTLRALAPQKNHLIISAIEHHAILHTAEALVGEGYQLTVLPVDRDGFISLKELKNAIRPDTALISIMMVNNEIGTIQDIPHLAGIAKQQGVLFHTDAVQGVPYLEVDVKELGVDFLSLSAHKMYGPKGVGVLYIKNGTPLKPLLFGGAQERKFRPGTENVPGILGLGAAMKLRMDRMLTRQTHLGNLRGLLISGLEKAIPGSEINGPQSQVAPHVISVTFLDVDGEMLLFHLSQLGVAVSLGSACTSEDLEPSHVLTALGMPLEKIEGTLRISVGEPTTPTEIEDLLQILPAVVDRARLD
ncbi:MAG: cysteine desulfurase, partial [Chloroflexi bacterium]|nr:cysteine desulfurase [Chloroflexota bacterium]